MRNTILTSAAAIALIIFSAPAFAQMNQNMPGMNMSGSSKVAGNEKHRCMMHMTKVSMSLDQSNALTGSNLEPRHFQATHPGGSGSR